MAQRTRAPVLDTVKQREICAILTFGGSRRTAAKYVGCSHDTIRRTAERDEEFSQRLKKAESDLEVLHLSIIREAAKKNWRASAWVLERIHPERFARRDPDAITRDQLGAALSSLADILIEEVPLEEQQENILRRVDAIVAQLQANGNGNGNGHGHAGNGDTEQSDTEDHGAGNSSSGNSGT